MTKLAGNIVRADESSIFNNWFMQLISEGKSEKSTFEHKTKKLHGLKLKILLKWINIINKNVSYNFKKKKTSWLYLWVALSGLYVLFY